MCVCVCVCVRVHIHKRGYFCTSSRSKVTDELVVCASGRITSPATADKCLSTWLQDTIDQYCLTLGPCRQIDKKNDAFNHAKMYLDHKNFERRHDATDSDCISNDTHDDFDDGDRNHAFDTTMTSTCMSRATNQACHTF